MTREQAHEQFMEYVYPNIPKYRGEDDDTWLREEWNNWLDALAQEGQISQNDADTWECAW